MMSPRSDSEGAIAKHAVFVRLTPGESGLLRRYPDVLADWPPDLKSALTAGGSHPIRLLFGEIVFLMQCLDDFGMDPKILEPVASDIFALRHRLEGALEQQWAPMRRGAWFHRQVLVRREERIPLPLHRSEWELLRTVALPPGTATRMMQDRTGSSWRIYLTLGEIDALFRDVTSAIDEELVGKLEQRFDYALRCFSDGEEEDEPGSS